MARTPILSDDEILGRLTDVFREYGYEGASLTTISQATGLVRASLYHRFPGGKAEMAERVMRRALRWLEEVALAPLAGTSRPPEERIGMMVKQLDAFYASGEKSCLLDALSLGVAGGPLRRLAHTALDTWTDSLTALVMEAGFDESEAARRADEAVALVQGALVLARVRGDPAPFGRVLDELPTRLLGK